MKKILSVLITTLMIISTLSFTSFAAPNTPYFTDVDANTIEGQAIYKLSQAGVVNGNGDGTFAPYRYVTRAELCKMVNTIWNFKEVATDTFTDVTSDKWYYYHVLVGKKAGYINGFEDGTFRGDTYVTREQACAIIHRVAGLYPLGNVNITDAVSPWAVSYVNDVIVNKIMDLELGNTFRATQFMTRAELSIPLAKFAKIPETPQGSGNTGSGNTGSGNTGSGNTGSGNTGSGNTGSSGTNDKPTDTPSAPGTGTDTPSDSGNTGSGNTGSGNTGSGNTGSGNTGSGGNTEAKKYVVTFDFGYDGAPEGWTYKNISENSTFGDNLPNPPKREGYTFVRWVIKGTSAQFTKTTKVTSNLNIVAFWKPIECEVTFDFGYDASSEKVTQKVIYGQVVGANMPDAKRDNYAFVGWVIKGTTEEFTASTIVKSDIEVIAKWEKGKTDYSDLNDEVVTNLKKARSELDTKKNTFRPREKAIIIDVIDVLDKIIAKKADILINEENIKLYFEDEIKESILDYKAFPTEERTHFKVQISQLEPEVFDFLCIFFDVNMNNIDDKVDDVETEK